MTQNADKCQDRGQYINGAVLMAVSLTNVFNGEIHISHLKMYSKC